MVVCCEAASLFLPGADPTGTADTIRTCLTTLTGRAGAMPLSLAAMGIRF